jgi:hypothetical protein
MQSMAATSKIDSIEIGPVKLINVNSIISQYVITAMPIGMNDHIPKSDYTINVINGIPDNFKFYEGYDKKYRSQAEESLDLLDPIRIKTIGKCK